MNLLGFNIHISRASRVAALAVQKSFSPTGEEWLRGESGGGGAILSNAYEQVVWVYRAINVLAEQVANVPFLFSAGERGRENLITSGPLLDFYARPHPQINRFQYWELRIIWLMLRGECFRVPIYDDTGSPRPSDGRGVRGEGKSKLKTVLILDPARFQHIVQNQQLIGWRYTGFGPNTPLASQVFLPEEVWFEKLPNPFDFWRGLPPLQVAGMAARTDFAASAFMQGIIENNADTGLIVRTDKWLDDDQRHQIIAALTDRKRKAGSADRPVLLLGSAEVIKPQLSSSDLQFLENRKFSRAEICAAFGVPEEIVTTTDSAKYDVMAGARLNFIENRVAPLCSRLEAEEDALVKSIDPQAGGWFDLDSLPIMQEARRNRLTAARTGFEMGVPFNELNRVLDLGFKPLPWGETGYLPAKYNALNSLPTPEIENQKSIQPSTNPFLRAAGLLCQLNHSQPATPELLSKLRRFFFEQRARALAKLPTWIAGISPISPFSGPLLNLPSETTQLSTLLSPLVAAQLVSAAANTRQQLALESTPLPDSFVLEYLQSRNPHFDEINQTTLAALQQTLDTGLAAAETPDQLAARVKTVFNEATAHRAQTIAEVEAAAAHQAATALNLAETPSSAFPFSSEEQAHYEAQVPGREAL